MKPESRLASAAYLFGDSDLAAQRLRLLADAFAPSTREFLEPFAALSPQQVLDLGCGPGHTTRLLADMFPQAQVLGLDKSDYLIALARDRAAARVSFAVGDVTSELSARRFDVIYCRYLLTHLPRPKEAILLWGEHLATLGRLAVEEVEWIDTDQPALAKYLRIVAAMLDANGQRLYIGAELDRVVRWPSLESKSSAVKSLRLTNRVAAQMFLMNLQNWRRQPFVERNYSAAEIDQLHADLGRLAAGDERHSQIVWGIRQIVLEKSAS